MNKKRSLALFLAVIAVLSMVLLPVAAEGGSESSTEATAVSEAPIVEPDSRAEEEIPAEEKPAEQPVSGDSQEPIITVGAEQEKPLGRAMGIAFGAAVLLLAAVFGLFRRKK